MPRQAGELALCPTSFLVQLFLFCCKVKESWTEAVLWKVENKIANCVNVELKKRLHMLENTTMGQYSIGGRLDFTSAGFLDDLLPCIFLLGIIQAST